MDLRGSSPGPSSARRVVITGIGVVSPLGIGVQKNWEALLRGQSGIGPHARDERHFIPSIEPYYRSLNELAKLWKIE